MWTSQLSFMRQLHFIPYDIDTTLFTFFKRWEYHAPGSQAISKVAKCRTQDSHLSSLANRWLSVKNLPAHAGDTTSIPASERSPGEENGNPIPFSCLGNPMDRGSLVGYSSWNCQESDTTERLNSNRSLALTTLSYLSASEGPKGPATWGATSWCPLS